MSHITRDSASAWSTVMPDVRVWALLQLLTGEGDEAGPFFIPLVSGVNVQTKIIHNLTCSGPSGTRAGSVFREEARERENECSYASKKTIVSYIYWVLLLLEPGLEEASRAAESSRTQNY